jgi:hypothetical protein
VSSCLVLFEAISEATVTIAVVRKSWLIDDSGILGSGFVSYANV